MAQSELRELSYGGFQIDPGRSPFTNRDKMAAAATMMHNFGQSVSAKSDLVPDWTSQEVSTGVSTLSLEPEWTDPGSGPVRAFKLKSD